MKRLAIVAATVLLTACAGKSRVAEPNNVSLAKLTPDAAKMERAELANITGAEMRVRLNQDLGPGISTVNGTFSARLISPIVGSRGRVLVPVGSLVHGHVIHVDEASRRVEIAFDRLETRSASYWMRATVVTAQPYAVTVRPEGTPSNESVVLQGAAPSAIGGGPQAPESEADESAPRVDAIVPFDAELRLKLTAPIGKS
jgi:hypothetical protein